MYLRDKAEVKHLVYVSLPILYPDQEFDDEQKKTYASATSGIEQSVIEIRAVSPERAQAWLEVTYPELLEEIESRILSDQPGYEDPLTSLHGLRLDTLADISDDVTRWSIESYLNHVLSFDRELPYTIDLHGPLIPASEDDDQIYTVRNSRSLAKIDQVKVLPNPILDEDVWGVAVHIQLYGPDHQGEVSSWLAPVDTLRSVVSMRRIYYEQ